MLTIVDCVSTDSGIQISPPKNKVCMPMGVCGKHRGNFHAVRGGRVVCKEKLLVPGLSVCLSARSQR